LYAVTPFAFVVFFTDKFSYESYSGGQQWIVCCLYSYFLTRYLLSFALMQKKVTKKKSRNKRYTARFFLSP
jgi:hypothetical protein